jgi:hypothetical protein
VPTFTAFAVTQLLLKHTADLVDYDFTARMEDGLDAIANGEREPVPWLRDFYFGEPGERDDGDHRRRRAEGAGELGRRAIDPRSVSRSRSAPTDDGEEVVRSRRPLRRVRAARRHRLAGRRFPTTWPRTS